MWWISKNWVGLGRLCGQVLLLTFWWFLPSFDSLPFPHTVSQTIYLSVPWPLGGAFHGVQREGRQQILSSLELRVCHHWNWSKVTISEHFLNSQITFSSTYWIPVPFVLDWKKRSLSLTYQYFQWFVLKTYDFVYRRLFVSTQKVRGRVAIFLGIKDCHRSWWVLLLAYIAGFTNN